MENIVRTIFGTLSLTRAAPEAIPFDASSFAAPDTVHGMIERIRKFVNSTHGYVPPLHVNSEGKTDDELPSSQVLQDWLQSTSEGSIFCIKRQADVTPLLNLMLLHHIHTQSVMTYDAETQQHIGQWLAQRHIRDPDFLRGVTPVVRQVFLTDAVSTGPVDTSAIRELTCPGSTGFDVWYK